MHDNDATAAISRAFGLGCNARIMGIDWRYCPYPYRTSWLRIWWLRGWDDVDRFWGVWVRGTDKFKELPPVCRRRRTA